MFGLTPYNRNYNVSKRGRDIFDIESLFGNFFNDGIFQMNNQMKVDVKENEKEYIVEAELPGIKKEEIVVDLKDERLVISVEKNEEINEEKENYVRRERHYGTMSRAFLVPDTVGEKAEAKFENGILTIVIPKAKQIPEKSTRINIS